MPGQHFETGNFRRPTKEERFLSDAEYGRALRALVISTCDIVVLDPEGRMLLGKRAWEPVKGQFWLIGGRRIPGESFGESAARNIERELGIKVAPERFQYLGGYSLAFDKRRQPPEQEGTHIDSTTLVLKLSEEEVAALKPNEEYSETLWITLGDAVKRASEFHQAIIQICKDLLAGI